MVRRKRIIWLSALLLCVALCAPAWSATVSGYVLDPNWYAPHPYVSGLYGTGQYEYGAAGNIVNDSTNLGFYEDTDIYGRYYKMYQPAGTYTLASWDVWWRSAFVFNQSIISDFAPNTYLRLHANMWTYSMNWGGHYHELGQTFVATGKSVTMIKFFAPDNSSVRWTVTIHQGGPDGPQVGPSKNVTAGGERRIKYSGDQVPTVPGQLYYIKFIATDSSSDAPISGALGINDPIPDLSDPMPEGCSYTDGIPDGGMNDLALVVCSDDDGLLTDFYIHKAELLPSVSSAGETFTARGTSLVQFCAWISDTTSTFVATLYDAVNGSQIGPAKKNRVMRSADPEVMWLWSPGECPLTPGNTYYIEVTKDGGGNFPIMASRWNEYWSGAGYVNRTALGSGWDLCGTLMEEESSGSATIPTVEFPSFPAVAFADRGTTSLTVRWVTNVPADSRVEYTAWGGAYTDTYYNSALQTSHVVTLTGLEPNTMYHLRVSGAASGHRTGVTRDFVACTINDSPNILVNPSFEIGSPLGTNPNVQSLDGWTASGLSLQSTNGLPPPPGTSPGTFLNKPPYAGTWYCEGAANNSSCNGLLYQRVDAVPGQEYNFTAALASWMMEGDSSSVWFKYDVWSSAGRQEYLRIGIDPYGGTDRNSPNIKWTPRMYSHMHFTTLGVRAVAVSNKVTVFVSLYCPGGSFVKWHLYQVDDCRLSAVVSYAPYTVVDLKCNQPDGVNAEVGDLIITATPSEAGAYYAETEDRAQGIRIVTSDPADAAPVGARVTVRGTLYSDPQTGERSLVNARLVAPSADSEPEPMMMQCKSVGGEALGAIPEIPDSFGPHNTGLAIKVAGKVTVKAGDSSYVFINDGSLPGDGLKVDTSHVAPALVPEVDRVLGIAGISSAYYDGGVKPLLIVRRAGDVGP